MADVEIEGEYQFERRLFGSNPEQLRLLAEWLIEQEVVEVVMESTAQYWQPVWGALERYWRPICQKREGADPKSGTLHLAQAQSNRGPRGRKKDFPDAERLVKRLVANELRQRPIIRSTRTLRIRQYNSPDFSTDVSTSPLRASPILPLTLSNFHEVSRVIGPIGQYRRTASLRAIATLAVFRRSTALRPRKAALVPLTKRTESIFIVNFGASAVLFFPAAPFFLLMHGSDITIPKGTEVTTYINGAVPIQLADFGVPTIPQPNAAVQPASIRPTPNCDVRPQDCWWPKQ